MIRERAWSLCRYFCICKFRISRRSRVCWDALYWDYFQKRRGEIRADRVLEGQSPRRTVSRTVCVRMEGSVQEGSQQWLAVGQVLAGKGHGDCVTAQGAEDECLRKTAHGWVAEGETGAVRAPPRECE